MKIDFGDVFGSGVGLLIKQLVLILLAIWLGCVIAAVAYICGECVDHFSFRGNLLWLLPRSPFLLLTSWILPNLFFLAVMGVRLIFYSDDCSVGSWRTLIGGEALFAMAAVTHELKHDWMPLTTAWVICLIQLIMVGTGLWFLKQWQTNRWAGELAMLKAENAARRIELKETLGTESAGIDETGLN